MSPPRAAASPAATRPRRREAGAISVELVILFPMILLVIALVAAYGRLALVNGTFDSGVRDAARAATQERSAETAEVAARDALVRAVEESSLPCLDSLELDPIVVFVPGRAGHGHRAVQLPHGRPRRRDARLGDGRGQLLQPAGPEPGRPVSRPRPRLRVRRAGRDAGTIAPAVPILVFVLLLLGGLVLDASRQLNARGRAVAYAEEAARAGASAIVLENPQLQLDEDEARRRVRGLLRLGGGRGRGHRVQVRGGRDGLGDRRAPPGGADPGGAGDPGDAARARRAWSPCRAAGDGRARPYEGVDDAGVSAPGADEVERGRGWAIGAVLR